MSEQGMQPEAEKGQPPDDSDLAHDPAIIAWNPGGVSIRMPDVDGSQPSSVTWDGSSAAENSEGRWENSTTEDTNSLSGVYGESVYGNTSIPRNETSVVLTKR